MTESGDRACMEGAFAKAKARREAMGDFMYWPENITEVVWSRLFAHSTVSTCGSASGTKPRRAFSSNPGTSQFGVAGRAAPLVRAARLLRTKLMTEGYRW